MVPPAELSPLGHLPRPPGFYLFKTLILTLLEPTKEPHSPKLSPNPRSGVETLSQAASLSHRGKTV